MLTRKKVVNGHCSGRKLDSPHNPLFQLVLLGFEIQVALAPAIATAETRDGRELLGEGLSKNALKPFLGFIENYCLD